MICVLLVASGAGWESTALGLLSRHPDLVVLKRCVDVDDLMATAAAGQADCAVVALDAPGLNATAVEHLRRHRVRPVAVVAGAAPVADRALARAAQVGITALLPESEIGDLARLVESVEDEPPYVDEPVPEAGTDAGPADGRVVAVWGPQGAPGRTTVAVGLAAALAHRGDRAVLVDADPWGGAVAQQLGILDEVSGLLAAGRLAGSGLLGERFESVARSVGEGLAVVTGLPRADRWVEIRPGAVESLLDAARDRGRVVVDTGFSLEADPGAELAGRPTRNGLTLAALARADEVVVVGTPDPVGLSRLARGLVELRETLGARPVHVVVNRHRPSLGWGEADVVGMVEGFARVRGVHFLPEDRAAVDKALVAGRTLVETGESALARSLGDLADAVLPPVTTRAASGRLRRRTAARAHRR
ncbi:MAG: hypothetical protein U0R80_09000 [Nocardioidaceae bacterium]